MEQQNKKRIDGNKSKKQKQRLFRAPITAKKVIVWCLLLLLVAAIVLAGRFVYRTVINPVSAFDDTKPIATPKETASSTTKPAQEEVEITPQPTITLSPREMLEQSADHDFMRNRVNVLVTGIDYSIERDGKGRMDFRTDTILLISVDFETSEIDMISVPRDSYADIAFTEAKWKINGAYMTAGGAEGDGFACMMQTVSDCIGGIPVDYYVAVEMQAVKDIVDIIGGVWYDVEYEIEMNKRHLSKGYQHLDGQAVLDYLRVRKGITGNSDIARIDRQQRLLMEVFNQMKQASLVQDIPRMYKALEPQIMTNLNFEQIVALSLFALDFDIETGIERYTLRGEYMAAYNASKYYVLDHEYTEVIIREIFGVSPNINWEYSLEFVKNYMANVNLDEIIIENKQMLIDNQVLLGYVYTLLPIEPGQDELEFFEFGLVLEEYLFIVDQMDIAAFALETQDTQEMEAAIELMEELEEDIRELIKAPPMPSPTPTPTPMPTPTPSPTPSPTPTPTPTPTETP